MRIFHYASILKWSKAELGDTVVVCMSVLDMDYTRWVTALSPFGRLSMDETMPNPLYGFRVKELKPKPNQLII